jgi:ATP-binding cassette, subfamily B, bacterial PglK
MLLATSKKILYLFTSKERTQVFLLLVCMLIGSILELVGLGVIPIFTSFVAQSATVINNPYVVHFYKLLNLKSHEQLIVVVGILLVALYVFKSIFLFSVTYIEHTFIFNKMRRLTVNLYRTYLGSDYTFHLERNSAELINYIKHESYHLFMGVVIPFISFLTELVLVTLIVISLVAVEPIGMLSVVIVTAILGAIYYQLIKQKLVDIGEVRQVQAGKMLQWIAQGLNGIKEIKVIGREEFFVSQFDNHVKMYTGATKLTMTLEIVPRMVLETFAIIIIVGLVMIGLSQGRSPGALLSGVTLFAVAAFRLLPAVNRVLVHLTSINYNLSSLNVIYNDLRSLEKQAVIDRTYNSSATLAPINQISLNQVLELQNVAYHYPNSEQLAIPDLSMILPKGHMIGIVGHSGAGKTTFIDLLLGLLTPTSGKILADGVDINTNLDSWRENIGYIPQNIYLFDDTIRANIAFGCYPEQIDEEHVWQVLQAVQLHDFVQDLPDRLDTMIGESGARLSGGQRQRLGIARALYLNPRLLIMDEATSALDNQTERAVAQAIEKLSKDRTVIIVAHRLTTVQKCDVIYMMNRGKISCAGTYEQLLATSPEFQKLALAATKENK